MDIGEEIDKLFLEPKECNELDILDIIKGHLNTLEEYLQSIGSFEHELEEHKKIHEYYRLKLETLSNELQEIEAKSLSTQTKIYNKKRLYDEIKNLIVIIEIKPEYYNRVKNPNFSDLTGLKIALNVLKSFDCKYEIKAVNEKKEKINHALKEFINNFLIFFQKRINTYETESRGELKIHQHVYDDVRKYEFVFDYCREHDKDNFITLSRKYLTISKTLYEQEFEQHLKIILKSLRDYKSKLKEKMDEALNVIVESFYLIVACETNFIGKIFDDNAEFLNEYVKNIFDNIIEIVCDFLRDIFRIHNLYAIIALNNACQVESNQDTADLGVVIKFKTKLKDFLNDFKKDYIRIKKQNWRTDSKRKFYKNLINEIKDCEYDDMNKELSMIFLDKINDMSKDKKGKIEFVLYKLNFIKDIQKLHFDENESKIHDMRKKELESLEKEVIVYIFGCDKNKAKDRIKNIRDLINSMIKDDQEHKDYVTGVIKNIINDQDDDNVKIYAEKTLK